MDDDELNQDANQAMDDWDDVDAMARQYVTDNEKAAAEKHEKGEKLKQRIHKLQQQLARIDHASSPRTQRTRRLIVEGATLEKALGIKDDQLTRVVGYIKATANQQRQMLTEYKDGTLNQTIPQHAQENTADDYRY